jgi:hypothetical protein
LILEAGARRVAGLGLLVVLAASAAHAHEAGSVSVPPPPALALPATPQALPDGVQELKFSDFFRRPVGPTGLEPSARLLSLAGQRVRIVGYMAAAALPMAGRLVLAPMPVELGDEDEHLADDLPPQAVFVHLSGPAAERVLPNYRGLLALTGRLEIGASEEPDGHVSTVRLLLDPDASRACLPDALVASQ